MLKNKEGGKWIARSLEKSERDNKDGQSESPAPSFVMLKTWLFAILLIFRSAYELKWIKSCFVLLTFSGRVSYDHKLSKETSSSIVSTFWQSEPLGKSMSTQIPFERGTNKSNLKMKLEKL